MTSKTEAGPMHIDAPVLPGLEHALEVWMNDDKNHPPGSGPNGQVLARDVWGFSVGAIRTLLLAAANLALQGEAEAGFRISIDDFTQQARDLYEFLAHRRQLTQGPRA